MPFHNPAGAAGRLHTISVDGYGEGKNAGGECLRWNYFALGAQPNLTPAGIAMDAWNHAPAEHRHPIPTNGPVPADHPIILGPVDHARWPGDHTYPDGDVFLSNGTGVGLDTSAVATDFPSVGVIGNCTIRDRAQQTGRPVLGYLTSWLGYDLTTGEATASDGPGKTITDTPTEEDDMKLIVLIADKATDKKNKEYGSTAVITPSKGFVRTSSGLGPRGSLNAAVAAATAAGIPISTKHVSIAQFNDCKVL